MKRYRIGIVYEFEADDEEHAAEQLADVLAAESVAAVMAELNYCQEVTPAADGTVLP